jgi:hypothetical protein
MDTIVFYEICRVGNKFEGHGVKFVEEFSLDPPCFFSTPLIYYFALQ